MDFQMPLDDLVEDLGIHFDVSPLNTQEGWSLDDDDNKETADEARIIIRRWLINRGLVVTDKEIDDLEREANY